MSNQPPRPDKRPDFAVFEPGSSGAGDYYGDLGFGFEGEEDPCGDEAPDSAFDVGTSPHGLSADLPLPYQETRVASGSLPSAKPVLSFALTEEQRDHLAFAATCQIEVLVESHEADALEVQEAIRDLCDAHSVLTGEQS